MSIEELRISAHIKLKLIFMSKNFQNGLTNGSKGGKIKQLQKPFYVNPPPAIHFNLFTSVRKRPPAG